MKEEKKVKMAPVAGAKESGSKKLSYEELERVANSLNQKCGQFYQQLQEANAIIANFDEIGLLLNILGKSEFFSESFVARCAGKIEETMTKALDESDKQKEEKTEEKN